MNEKIKTIRVKDINESSETNPNYDKIIIDENVRILILGTMPPKKVYTNNDNFSFYDSDDNWCWTVYFKEIFNLDLKNDYENKKKELLNLNIGMADIIVKTNRKNNDYVSDKGLDPCEILDLNDLLIKYPNIEVIFTYRELKDKFIKPKYGNNNLLKQIEKIPCFSKGGVRNGEYKGKINAKKRFEELFDKYHIPRQN